MQSGKKKWRVARFLHFGALPFLLLDQTERGVERSSTRPRPSILSLLFFSFLSLTSASCFCISRAASHVAQARAAERAFLGGGRILATSLNSDDGKRKKKTAEKKKGRRATLLNGDGAPSFKATDEAHARLKSFFLL